MLKSDWDDFLNAVYCRQHVMCTFVLNNDLIDGGQLVLGCFHNLKHQGNRSEVTFFFRDSADKLIKSVFRLLVTVLVGKSIG